MDPSDISNTQITPLPPVLLFHFFILFFFLEYTVWVLHVKIGNCANTDVVGADCKVGLDVALLLYV